MLKIHCPICKAELIIYTPDWTLSDQTVNGHQEATICTAENASLDIRDAARLQIASNVAAYDLNYDTELDLVGNGRAWIQCPTKRETITEVCFPK